LLVVYTPKQLLAELFVSFVGQNTPEKKKQKLVLINEIGKARRRCSVYEY